MNLIKKLYCRTFQTVFRVALPILPYRKPKRLNDMDALISLLEKKKIHSVLLVTDQSIRSFGITKPLEEKLALLIAIPTTARTESETTLAAVIVDAETRHKYPINDFPLIPRYAGGNLWTNHAHPDLYFFR